MRREAPRLVHALLGVIALATLAAPAAGAVEIALSDDYPLRGEPVTVTLSGDDATAVRALRVTYRPNSQTLHEETLAVAAGAVEWTPRDAGIVRLEALDGDQAALQTRNAAVRFGRFPAPGIAVMSLAAALLFGGAALAMVALLRAPATLEDEVEPPST